MPVIVERAQPEAVAAPPSISVMTFDAEISVAEKEVWISWPHNISKTEKKDLTKYWVILPSLNRSTASEILNSFKTSETLFEPKK